MAWLLLGQALKANNRHKNRSGVTDEGKAEQLFNGSIASISGKLGKNGAGSLQRSVVALS
jgi:hypothetical protein